MLFHGKVVEVMVITAAIERVMLEFCFSVDRPVREIKTIKFQFRCSREIKCPRKYYIVISDYIVISSLSISNTLGSLAPSVSMFQST